MHRINWIFPIANDFNLFLLFLKGPTQNRVGSWCFLPFFSALYVMLIAHTHLEFTFCLRMATGLLHFHGCSFAQLCPIEGRMSSGPCSAAFLHASHHPLAFGSFTSFCLEAIPGILQLERGTSLVLQNSCSTKAKPWICLFFGGPSPESHSAAMHWTAYHVFISSLNYLFSAAGAQLLLKAKLEYFAAEAKHFCDRNCFHHKHLLPR